MPKLGTKLREGIFAGYDQIVGGGWSGGLYVLDWCQLEASGALHQVYVRILKAEEVFPEKNAEGVFRFPCATGELSQPTGTTRSFRRFQKKFIVDDEPDEMYAVEEDADDGAAQADANYNDDDDDKQEDDCTAQEVAEDKGDSEDVLDRDSLEKSEGDEDYWSLNGTCLTRHR